MAADKGRHHIFILVDIAGKFAIAVTKAQASLRGITTLVVGAHGPFRLWSVWLPWTATAIACGSIPLWCIGSREGSLSLGYGTKYRSGNGGNISAKYKKCFQSGTRFCIIPQWE